MSTSTTRWLPTHRCSRWDGLLVMLILVLPTVVTRVGAVEPRMSATVYIGSHFEVRDHDQPTKYVFNGPTRVASVIGSLSAAPRVQRVRLRQGWNLLSLAVSVSNLTAQFQISQPGGVQAIYKWNVHTSDYSPVAPGQAVLANTVLWVRAITDCFASLAGDYVEPATNLRIPAGGAYLPGTALESWAPALPVGCSEWQYDAGGNRWRGHFSGDLALTSDTSPIVPPGNAVFIVAAAPTALQAPDFSLRFRYYHPDHLGSSSLQTDASGNTVEERAYYPFGAPRIRNQLRAVEEPYGFTEKERDCETTLHYFEARYLTAVLSRFSTVDFKYARPDALSEQDLTSYLSDPQQANPYAYVRNNPICNADPSGLDITTPLTGRTVARGPRGSKVVTLQQHFKQIVNGTEVDKVRDVKVIILPDNVIDTVEGGKQAKTTLNMHENYNPKKRTVTESITIQTSYKRGVNPLNKEAAGRGTTEEDIKNTDTSIKFHEGNHGVDFLNFLEANPFPEFTPGSGDLLKAAKEYSKSMDEYHAQAIQDSKVRTDCVGIPEFDDCPK